MAAAPGECGSLRPAVPRWGPLPRGATRCNRCCPAGVIAGDVPAAEAGHQAKEPTMKVTTTAVRCGTAAASIAAAAILVPAVALASSGSPASATGAAAPQCATSGLVVWLNTTGNG